MAVAARLRRIAVGAGVFVMARLAGDRPSALGARRVVQAVIENDATRLIRFLAQKDPVEGSAVAGVRLGHHPGRSEKDASSGEKEEHSGCGER